MSEEQTQFQTMNLGGAIDSAMEHTKAVLFSPFEAGRWLKFGVVIFLASLSGWGFNMRPPIAWFVAVWQSNTPSQFSGAPGMIWGQFLTIRGLTIGSFVAVALAPIFGYLGVRGILMFIHMVATDRDYIGEAWDYAGKKAGSLYRWWLMFYGIVLINALVVLWLAHSIHAAPSLNDSRQFFKLFAMNYAEFPVLLVAMLLFHLITAFVAPMMWRYDLPAKDAAKLTWKIAATNILTILLYILFLFIIGMVLGFARGLACCFTFGLGLLPVISHTILSPFHVWFRSLSLCLLDTASPDIQMIQPLPEDPLYETSASAVSDAPVFDAEPQAKPFEPDLSAYQVPPPVEPVEPESPDDADDRS